MRVHVRVSVCIGVYFSQFAACFFMLLTNGLRARLISMGRCEVNMSLEVSV